MFEDEQLWGCWILVKKNPAGQIVDYFENKRETKKVSTQQAFARIHGRIRDVNGVLHYLRRPGIKGVLRVALNDEGNLGASAQGLPNAKPRAHILVAFYGRIVELPNQRKGAVMRKIHEITWNKKWHNSHITMIPEMESDSYE